MLLGIGALGLGAYLKKPWLMWLGGLYAAGSALAYISYVATKETEAKP